MSLDQKRMTRETGNAYTTTLRVHRRVYHELERLKAIYEERLNAELSEKALHEHSKVKPVKNGRKQNQLIIPVKRVSFSDLLTECCKLGDLLLSGQILYLSHGKVFEDVKEARGNALMESLEKKSTAVAPHKLLCIGEDGLMT